MARTIPPRRIPPRRIPRPLPAIGTLNTRLEDAKRLIEIHEEFTGKRKGRRRNIDALNRSCIILTVAAWEGFVEDVTSFAAETIAKYKVDPSGLPVEMIHALIKHYHKNETWDKRAPETYRSIWCIAGDGWRDKYVEFSKHCIERLNAPDHSKVNDIFKNVLGLNNFSENWVHGRWGRETYVNKLNSLLKLRHKIAHGALGTDTVGKAKATNNIKLVHTLSSWTEETVRNHLRTIGI